MLKASLARRGGGDDGDDSLAEPGGYRLDAPSIQCQFSVPGRVFPGHPAPQDEPLPDGAARQTAVDQ